MGGPHARVPYDQQEIIKMSAFLSKVRRISKSKKWVENCPSEDAWHFSYKNHRIDVLWYSKTIQHYRIKD